MATELTSEMLHAGQQAMLEQKIQPSFFTVHPDKYGWWARLLFPLLAEADSARGVEVDIKRGQRLDNYRSKRKLPGD